jgi:ABC-type amino acid transport substrate-binding protein
MLKNKSFYRLYLTVLVIFFIAIPDISRSNLNSGAIPDTIKSASELDYPPFSIIRKDGTAYGFSVELLRAAVKAAGKDISFFVGPWSEIKQKLIDRQLDVLPLVSYSKERDEVLDFSAPYLRMHGTIFVRKGEESIHTEADLAGKEVLVMRGDTAHEYAITRKLSDKLILKDSFEQAMQDLSRGKHDALIVQQLVGYQLIKKLNISNIVDVNSFEETGLKPSARPLTGFEQKFCFAVPEGEKELLSLLNEGLSLVIADGTFDELYHKWFGPILPHPPMAFRW